MRGRGLRSRSWALAALAALLWAACRTAPPGPIPAEPGADPSVHGSYGFVWPLGTEDESPELSERLRLAVSHELEDRGYLYDADAPAMRVDLHALPAPLPVEERDPGVRVGQDFFGNPIYLDAEGRRVPARVDSPERRGRALSIRVVDTQAGRMLWFRSSDTWPDEGAPVDQATVLGTVTELLKGFPRSAAAP